MTFRQLGAGRAPALVPLALAFGTGRDVRPVESTRGLYDELALAA
jgi:hypothetical protein